MAASAVLGKLRFKPGYRGVLMNPPKGYVEALGKLPDALEVTDATSGACDFALLFVSGIAELERLGPKAVRAVKDDGLLWISYPKKSSGVKTDINRDAGWDVIRKTGFDPVSLISVDDTWSALRFRPVAKIKRASKD